MRGGIESARPRQGRTRFGNAPIALLACLALTSGVLLVALNAALSWHVDDWGVLLFRHDWTADSLLQPQNEHITVSEIALFKVLLAIFGMDSLLPFSVAAILVFLLSAVLLFEYLRRRVGDWLALISTTVILFLGAAWEDLLWPIQIVVFGSVACGLGMLLALQREDRIGDRLACVLLAGSISFFTLGLVFAAGAAVDIVQRRDAWRRRFYIVAIPLLLYGLWWLGWGHTAHDRLSLHNLGTTPLFVLNSLAAGIASLLGLVNSSTGSPGEGLHWGQLLLPLVLLAGAWRLHQQKEVSRWFWVVAAIGFSSWILGGLAPQSGRSPDASRYQYASAIFILLMAAELMRGVRVGRKGLIVISVVAAASLAGNLTALVDSYNTRRPQSEQQRGGLAGLELARNSVAPSFDLQAKDGTDEFVISATYPWSSYTPVNDISAVAPPFRVFKINAGAYLAAVDKFGSPAYSPHDLVSSPEAARQAADRMLAAALPIRLVPTTEPASPGAGPGPSLIGPSKALGGSNRNCLHLNASKTSPPLLELPPGGAIVASSSKGAFEIRLRRYVSTVLPVDLGVLAAHTRALIDIPTDRSTVAWKLSLDGSGPVTVCGTH